MTAFITLHQPRRLIVGAGSIGEVGGLVGNAQATLVIATPITAGFVDRLQLAGKVEVFDAIPGEPDVATLEAALTVARRVKPQVVIGLGGGSVLDVAKLVAALWDSQQTLADVAGPNRVAGRNTQLVQVATTAGTGSEAGIRSLITDPVKGAKIAVESPYMIADIAVLDPELTFSVPPAVTAATGVDAMAHCVEAFTNKRAHPMIDGFARMGFRLVGKYLARAVKDGSDTQAREAMMLASYYGGICLGPVNTAAGHAIAYPLGTRLGLPHGLANAIVFPHVLAFNQPVVREKTAEVAEALGFSANSPEAILENGQRFCTDLNIEMRLSHHGAEETDLAAYAAEAYANRRLMDNNPADMTADDILSIYKSAY